MRNIYAERSFFSRIYPNFKITWTDIMSESLHRDDFSDDVTESKKSDISDIFYIRRLEIHFAGKKKGERKCLLLFSRLRMANH